MTKMILYIYIYGIIYIYYLCVWPLITIPFSHLPLVPRVSWRACSTTSLVTSSSRATEATECFTRGSSSSCAAKLSSSSTNHSWASQIFPGLNPSKNGGFTMVPWCNLASPCFTLNQGGKFINQNWRLTVVNQSSTMEVTPSIHWGFAINCTDQSWDKNPAQSEIWLWPRASPTNST